METWDLSIHHLPVCLSVHLPTCHCSQVDFDSLLNAYTIDAFGCRYTRKPQGCAVSPRGAGQGTRRLFKCIFGLKGHKYSSHNLQLHFSNGTQGIALRLCCLFCGCEGHLTVFLLLITLFLYEKWDSSPLYSSLSPVSLSPLPLPNDMPVIHSSISH